MSSQGSIQDDEDFVGWCAECGIAVYSDDDHFTTPAGTVHQECGEVEDSGVLISE